MTKEEVRFNIAGNITQDILKKHFSKEGRDIDIKKVTAEMNEYLGDKTLEELHFKFFKIPLNDRLKYYQLLMKYCNFRFYEEPKIEGGKKEDMEKEKKKYQKVWKTIIQPIVDNGQIFEVENELIPILQNTDSKEAELPYNQLIIDCRLPIKDRIYYGILLGTFYTEESIYYKGIISCYSYLDTDGERKLSLEWFANENIGLEDEKKNKYQKEVMNFAYSFCNFLNEPEVKIMEKQFNPKNNDRRVKKGRLPLPKNNFIRITGELRKYVEEYNMGIRSGYSHRFSVRGHFMHFRNKKKYHSLYELQKSELIEKGYGEVKGIITKWKKPFIKGKGILVKKPYKLVKKKE